MSQRAILIGASTGGVEALMKILAAFSETCPPTFIVQHTIRGFSTGLCRLLNTRTSAHVMEASQGLTVGAGTVVIAPSDRQHLQITRSGCGLRCNFAVSEPVNGHRPSIDILFGSAVSFAPRVSAAILTGMGRDGARGLLALRRAGARTFGQDAETSLVYGMPKVAVELGAVQRQLPLCEIGPALVATQQERTTA